jgi:hypothetical protein
MSDVTFQSAFVAPARKPVLAILRARVRQSVRHIAEVAEAYSLIEGTCVLTAMVFASLVITAALAGSV